MQVRPIANPFDGEHVIAVKPDMGPSVDGEWRSRANFYAGRTMTGEALAGDQIARDGRLALAGQWRAPGIVSGLEVRVTSEFEPTIEGPQKKEVWYIDVSPGRGLTARGEDVVVPRRMRARLTDIILRSHQAFDADLVDSTYYVNWRAGILLLRPVIWEHTDGLNADAASEDFAFEDVRIVEGCELLFHPWLGTPAMTRNELAWQVFERERELKHGDALPWEIDGVPIGLVSLQDIGSEVRVLFHDRHAVARRGGAPRVRTPMVMGAGTPRLWQAQIEQLRDQIASMSPQRFVEGTACNDFRYLPPVGVLPRNAYELEMSETGLVAKKHFFPYVMQTSNKYLVPEEIRPIPMEQLDAVYTACASLAPICITDVSEDTVRLLIPVSERDYEPRLLLRETADADGALSSSIGMALQRLAEWLGRRESGRRRRLLLLDTLNGNVRDLYSAPDPHVIPDEESAISPTEGIETTWDNDNGIVTIVENGLRQCNIEGTWNEPKHLAVPANATGISVAQGRDGVLEGVIAKSTGWQWFRTEGDDHPSISIDWVTNEILVRAVAVSVPESRIAVCGLVNNSNFHEVWLWWWNGTAWSKVTLCENVSAQALITAVHIGECTIIVAIATGTSFTMKRLSYGASLAVTSANLTAPSLGINITAIHALTAVSTGTSLHLFACASPLNVPNSTTVLQWLRAPLTRTVDGSLSIGTWQSTTIAGATPATSASSIRACVAGSNRIDFFVRTSTDQLNRGWIENDVVKRYEHVVTGIGDYGVAPRSDGSVYVVYAHPAKKRIFLRVLERSSSSRRFMQTSMVDRVLVAWADQPSNFMLAVGQTFDDEPAVAVVFTDASGMKLGYHFAKNGDTARQIIAARGVRGLVAEIARMRQRVEECVETGVARVQSEIQRAKQLMITGSTEASRLAVAPALGAAMGNNRVGLRNDIDAYLSRTRTTEVRSKIDQPDAVEVFVDAAACKAEIITKVSELIREFDIDMRDVAIQGVAKRNGGQIVLKSKTKVVLRENVFIDVVSWSSDATMAMAELIRKEPEDIANALKNADLTWAEGDYFGNAVELYGHCFALLHELEKVPRYLNQFATQYEGMKSAVETATKQVEARLFEVDTEIAEARYDVTAARALRAEDEARVAAINARRSDILENRVPFLVYHRARAVDLAVAMPEVALVPGVIGPVLPAAFATTTEPPPDLRDVLSLLREAPLRWFVEGASLVNNFGQLDIVRRTLVTARSRASIPIAPITVPANPTAPDKLKQIHNAWRGAVQAIRNNTARIVVRPKEEQSLRDLKRSAMENLSLGDVAAGEHGDARITKLAAEELEHLGRVATTLYQRFGKVPVAVRLAWSEAMGPYDPSIGLRSLSGLPRWDEIEIVLRYHLQALVEWLFSRMNANESEATGLMNDIVRVALLLACHAPVDKLISGQFMSTEQVKPGRLIQIKADGDRLRTGMFAIFGVGSSTIQGVVEDLQAGAAFVRIVSMNAATVQVPLGTVVTFAEPGTGAET